MPVITNLDNVPTLLVLNSGTELYLRPGEPRAFPDSDVRGNSRIKRLLDRKVVLLSPDKVEPQAAALPPPTLAASSSEREAVDSQRSTSNAPELAVGRSDPQRNPASGHKPRNHGGRE